MPRVAYAGAFLTAPGGYPSGRSWAPAATVREVTDPSLHPGVAGGAATAVDEQASFGASVIKVALNAQAGPVPEPAVLAAIVAAAHAARTAGRRPRAGRGHDGAARSRRASTRSPTCRSPRQLDAALIARRWRADSSGSPPSTSTATTTGAPHRATRTCQRFLVAGGTVLYGTDLGNGDLPVGVNPRELPPCTQQACAAPRCCDALTDPWPHRGALPRRLPPSSRATRPRTSTTCRPGSAAATVVPTEELDPR